MMIRDSKIMICSKLCWIRLILSIIGLYIWGCGGEVPPDGSSAGFSPELLAQLRSDYDEYNAPETPPENAFTDFEESTLYVFWDGRHLIDENGYALNTPGEGYENIAIIRYWVYLDGNADDVMIEYFDISGSSQRIPISSAYRDPAHNAGVGGVAWSRHIYGQAIDWNTNNTVLQGQQVWDACYLTGTTQLLNEPYKRTYRPNEEDPDATLWIHAGWGPSH